MFKERKKRIYDFNSLHEGSHRFFAFLPKGFKKPSRIKFFLGDKERNLETKIYLQ
jgi:hypothetical protein